MKKIGMTVFAALLGGVMALGGYKLLETKQHATIIAAEEAQKAHFASNVKIPTAPVGSVAFAAAASNVTPAVVHIKTTYEQKARSNDDQTDIFEQFFGVPQGRMQEQAQPAQASGSGVIIKEDGYIVTNNHVIENADKIEVVLPDKRMFEAKIIGRDPNTDLALIKIDAKGLPTVPVGNSDAVQIGEWVLAVGYPLSLESTVTAGIVSAKGRSIGIIDQKEREKMQQGFGFQQQQNPNKQLVTNAIESFIQTDAVINMGNSGGALVNTNGELVGINSALASPSGYYAGYGFAVPSNLVKKIVEDFVAYGRVNRGLVGLTFNELNPDNAKELGITDVNGLYVNEVVANGAAQKAGIRKGDILTKINGNVINESSDLQERVYRLHPGDKVTLTYKRDGKLHDATVTLMADKSADKSSAAKKEASRSATMIYNDLGAGFVPAPEAQKKRFHVSSGVLVTKVNTDGLFDYYSVPEGMLITQINGQAVNNVDDVESALGKGDHGMIRMKGYSPDGELMEMRFPSGK
ncbi:serine protease, S1-C subfamily, contains C-terminal PDZ domain [bacterium A37T11]|nr:serine protease, S1-C subfamily, contains C-terminal PDZ domain [bacterium A37T11]